MTIIIIGIWFLILVGVPYLFAVAANQSADKKELYWALACVAPVTLSVTFMTTMGFLYGEEPGIAAMHQAVMAVSGPLGLIVTMAMESNFPYDDNYPYFLVLVAVTLLQWFGIWALCKKLILNLKGSGLKALTVFFGILVFMAICTFVHFSFYVGIHT